MSQQELKKIKNTDYMKKTRFNDCSNIGCVRRYGNHYNVVPLVTVIMPTYRGQDTIFNSVKSVLNQEEFDDFQLLIVDNDDNETSMNETEKILRTFNSDKIIYYRNEKNIGMWANWNRCIRLAHSQWLCMINDDDIIPSKFLSIMMGIIKQCSKIDFLACDQKLLKEGYYDLEKELKINITKVEDKICKINYTDYTTSRYYLHMHGAIFKRREAIAIGGFGINRFFTLEDDIFCIKFSKYYSVFYYNEKLYKRIFGQNISSSKRDEWVPWSLVCSYYVMKSLIKEEKIWKRPFYYYFHNVKYLKHFEQVKKGTRFEKKVKINLNELKKQCGISYMNKNITWEMIYKIINIRNIIYDKYFREYIEVKLRN